MSRTPCVPQCVEPAPPKKSCTEPADDLSTLQLVTVIFRHGDRTPDHGNTYPNDPYKNQSFYPYNLGELTHKGQKAMYKLGQDLRKRYGAFLGPDYHTNLVKSTASSFSRCQMSLQVMHAGLFPPKDDNHSLPGLKWQAVPYDIIPVDQDKFLSLHKYCWAIMELTYPEIDEKDKKLMEYLQTKSGYEKVEYLESLRIYDRIKTCVEAGLEVPNWAKCIWPEPLTTLAYKFWQLLAEQRVRFGVGPLLHRITDEARVKIDGSGNAQVPCSRKMYIYAGHDLNLQILRGAFQVWTDERIGYCACMIFELHRIDDIWGFKLYFNNGYERPKLLRVPCCDEFIPFERFLELTQELYTPEETTCEEMAKPDAGADASVPEGAEKPAS